MLDQKKNKGNNRKYLANINVRWGTFNLDDLKEMPFKDSELERYGLRYGDIVMCEGGEPGRCAIWKDQCPGMMYQKALHRIRPHEGIDHRFLYYHFLLLGRKNGFAGLFTGSTIKHMPKDKLALVEIPLPPLPVQRRIADVLSAYDDLIENNRRRIAILEETARLAYRKWFGGAIKSDGGMRRETIDEQGLGDRHETIDDSHVSRLASKAARVTCLTSHAQSRVATLGEIVDVLYGKDHKKIPCGAIPIFGSGGVMRYGATAIFDKPSVLIPRKGSIGNVMYVDEPFWTVDTMFYTRFKLPNMEKILYYQLCDYNLASMSTGAAVPSMTTAILNSLEIEGPSDDLREKFDLAVEPMFEQKRLLKKQNTALAAARDMLLPRLMKGEMV
jgi:type I restriction enzyme S subunit